MNAYIEGKTQQKVQDGDNMAQSITRESAAERLTAKEAGALAEAYRYLVEFTDVAKRFDNFATFKALVESKGDALTKRDLTDLEVMNTFLCGQESQIAKKMEEGRKEMGMCSADFKRKRVAELPRISRVLGREGKTTQASELRKIADSMDNYISMQDSGTEYRAILRWFVFGIDPRELLGELKLAAMYLTAIEDLGLAGTGCAGALKRDAHGQDGPLAFLEGSLRSAGTGS